MDIKKAKRLIELRRDDRRIVVTQFENEVSSCVIEAEKRQRCETCAANDEACNAWLDHLKEQGYEVKEIDLADTEVQESLSRFMAERQIIEPIAPILGELPEELEPEED